VKIYQSAHILWFIISFWSR